ncbi:MAG: HAD family hydrolase [Bacteroidaceae bacterium]|nr:HAD family hydrolase [Bacteroidaceae bacterium]
MSTIKGVIFDYGGTIDTNGIHWGEVIAEQYRLAGIELERELYRNAYVHGERSLAKVPVIAPQDTFHTLLRKKISIQFEYLKEQTQSGQFTDENAEKIADGCYSKVKETLETSRGIIASFAQRFPMVLVTNFYGNMPVVLNEFGLEDFFKCIVESSVVGIRKPDPALFAMGVEALHIAAEEIVVIGDSYRKDIYPALTLGCKTVWLKNLCWEEEPIIEGYAPTAIINDIAQLPDIIAEINSQEP